MQLTGRALTAMAFVVTIPVATLSATGQAPTPAYTVPVAAGGATFTGNNPSIGGVVGINAVAGALAVTGQTPSVVLTGQSQGDVFLILGGSATLTLAGVAPSTTPTRYFFPDTGALTVDGQYLGVQFKSPDTGTLTFTGVAPSLAVQGKAFPGAGTLALTGQRPLLAFGSYPGAGSLTLTGQTPTRLAQGALSPASGVLTLTGQLPLLNIAAGPKPDTGALVFAGVAPVVSTGLGLPMTVGALTLDGVAPALSIDVQPQLGAAALSLSGVIPLVLDSGLLADTLKIVGAANLTLAGQRPVRLIVEPRWGSGTPRRLPGHHPLGRRR